MQEGAAPVQLSFKPTRILQDFPGPDLRENQFLLNKIKMFFRSTLGTFYMLAKKVVALIMSEPRQFSFMLL